MNQAHNQQADPAEGIHVVEGYAACAQYIRGEDDDCGDELQESSVDAVYVTDELVD